MAKRQKQIMIDTPAKEKIAQFRQDMDQELETAIDHHESKMIYIGIATLLVFAAVIYLAWKF